MLGFEIVVARTVLDLLGNRNMLLLLRLRLVCYFFVSRREYELSSCILGGSSFGTGLILFTPSVHDRNLIVIRGMKEIGLD